jgi:NAD(P)-dependent dehydrogenase (short-subunit alcohol dehydrogenase family)
LEPLRFDGRSVIITGAGRGVGRAHALLLASRGARVIVADNGAATDGSGGSAEPADAVVREITAAGGQAVACDASVADTAGAAAIVETALDHFGRIDVVINNAGASEPDLFEDLPIEHFQHMLDVNYLGGVRVLKAAWPHLRNAGAGRIVNTCTEGMFGVHHMATGFGGANGAMFGLTLTLATEGLKYGIRVNALAPRAATRMTEPAIVSRLLGVPKEMLEMSSARLAPGLVAPAAAFLAHESCTLNGEVLVAGGGQVLRLAVVATTGISQPDLTPEHIAEQLEAVLDLTGARQIRVQPSAPRP